MTKEAVHRGTVGQPGARRIFVNVLSLSVFPGLDSDGNSRSAEGRQRPNVFQNVQSSGRERYAMLDARLHAGFRDAPLASLHVDLAPARKAKLA